MSSLGIRSDETDLKRLTNPAENEHLEQLAQQHIRKIFEGYGGVSPDPSNPLYSALQGALRVISKELYAGAAHFLLELIQNADDNKYAEGLVPKIIFTLGRETSGRGYLLISCNERGSSSANVEAICRIQSSTKARKDGYIGEKGIGFKSVFRVAGKVFIASNCYTFLFDKNEFLGMLKPQWAKFPERHVNPHLTQLYLELENTPGDTCDVFEMIEHQLRTIDSRLLVFLRQVKSVDIEVEHPTSPWQRSLNCGNQESHGGEAVQLQTKSEPSQDSKLEQEELLIVRYTATNLTPTPDRADVTTSEIVLGLPLVAGEQSSVYAFLPVRNYGFLFLIQADFLLTADRGSINEGKRWNVELLDAIAGAFQVAVSRLLLSSLKYNWILILPAKQKQASSFFSPLAKKIYLETVEKDILESHCGSMHQPKDMLIVESRFRLPGSSRLYFDKPEFHASILSDNYDIANEILHAKLKDLGVHVMGFLKFCNDLIRYIELYREDYEGQSDFWHASLARVLLDNKANWSTNMDSVPLVPLSGPRLVSKSECSKVFFQSPDQHLRIPPGLTFHVVKQAASDNTQRKQLFEYLGVKNLDSKVALDKVFELHAKDSVPLSTADLAQQAVFVWRADQRAVGRAKAKVLKVRTASGKLVHGCDVYMDSTGPVSYKKVSEIFEGGDTPAPIEMLASEYIEAVKTEDYRRWYNWLQDTLAVATMPRWKHVDAPSDKPSKEMVWLFNKKQEVFFNVFRVHRQGCSEKMCKEMAKWRAYARNNGPFLPLEDMVAANDKTMMTLEGKDKRDLLPYLDLDTRDAKKWTCLKDLNITVLPTVSFLLKCLQACRYHEQSMECVTRVYNQIQGLALTEADSNTLRNTFSNSPLILLFGSSGERRWKKLTECRWKAPECFLDRQSVAQTYPGLQTLFVKHLKLPDSVPHDVLDELKALPAGERDISSQELARVKKLLERSKKERLRLPPWDRDSIYEIMRIWPGGSPVKLHRYRDLIVPDKHELSKAFGGKLPWHDMTTEEFDSLLPLLRIADYNRPGGSLFLSKRIDVKKRFDGEPLRNEWYEGILKSKAIHICSLFVALDGRDKARKLLLNLRVFVVKKVALTRTVKSPQGHEVQGTDGVGSVMFVPSQAVLMMLARDLERKTIPIHDVAYELARYCGIDGANRIRLVEYILQCYDDQQIREKLEESKYRVPIVQVAIEDLKVPIETSINAAVSSAIPATSSVLAEQQTSAGAGEKGAVILPTRKYEQRSPEPSEVTMRSGATTLTLPPSAFAPLGPTTSVRPGDATTRMPPFTARATVDTTVRENIAPPSSNNSRQEPKAKTPQAARGNAFVSMIPVRNGDADFAYLEADQSVVPGRSDCTRPLVRNHRSVPGRAMPAFERECFSEIRTEEALATDKDVGLAGEFMVHDLLEETISTYSETEWTSSMRNLVPGMLPFIGDDMDFADFTVSDTDGSLTRFLVQDGMEEAKEWLSNPPRYHIEVKSTTGGREAHFTISHNQFQKARKLADRQQVPQVYLLARVYDLGTPQPQISFHANPWKMRGEGNLRFWSYEVSIPK